MKLTLVFMVLGLSQQMYGQDDFFPEDIGTSLRSSRNINHSDGTLLQDVKRASGWLVFSSTESFHTCSCTMINNANQDRIPYILTAAHCLLGFNDQELFISFDYEMSDATSRGNRVDNKSISTVWRVNFETLVKDEKSDIALLRLIDPHPDLLQNTYAVGWDNRVSQATSSHISHPQSDHKKVFVKPATSQLRFKKDNFNVDARIVDVESFFYGHEGYWNGTKAIPEDGSSGGGEFSEDFLLKAVQSHKKEIKPIVYSSALLNSWYNRSSSLDLDPQLGTFLDPFSKSLNVIPGGYFNDLETIENESFDLPLTPGSFLVTPSVLSDDPTELHEDVVQILPSSLYGFLTSVESEYPVWLDLLGINAGEIGSSTLILSVWFLEKQVETGIYAERLIYGTYIDANISSNTEDEFKGESWDCDNPPTGYPPCNRIQSQWEFPSSGSFNVARNRVLRAIQNLSSEVSHLSNMETKIPVVIKLQNLGTDPVSVSAVSYPGEMPRNALQLFKPDEVLSKFKSYKYPESRFNSETLHINSLEITQGDYHKNIPTGNNGGYLNLVNYPHRIGPVVTSFNENVGRNLILNINLENPENVNFSYRVWIDYFNKDVHGGKNEDLFTYDFVTDQPEIHEVELFAEGVNQTGNVITLSGELPFYNQISLKPGQKRMTRMRVSVKEGAVPPVQFDQQGNGEVEDYLIEIVAPSCDEILPREYEEYAESVLPFCGEGNYLDEKNAMPYKGRFPAFEIGKQENIQYAKTKTPLTATIGGRKFVSNINETVDGVLVDQDLMMDVYYPVRAPESNAFKSPLVIYIFGGGFVGGERNNRLAKETCEWLAKKGYVVAAIDYRLGMDVGDQELAKRAVLRAWQDSRAAVQYWRSKSDDSDNRWKIDTDKVYILGHSAGGITSLHNAYLSHGKFLEELELSDGFLKAANPDYEVTYPKEDGSLVFFTKAYDLTTHTTTVCLTADCDTPLSTDSDAQANRAISFAGALGKKEWATDDILTMDIHHFNDGTVPYQRGKPFGWIARVGGWTGLLDLPEMDGGFAIGQYLDATFLAGTEEVGDAYQEANHFKLQSLTQPNQAGLGNSLVVPFHYPQLAFDTDIALVGEDSEGTKITPEVMYLVDAFFTKDWSTGVAARQNLEVAEESAAEEVQEEKVSFQTFSIFPNPASDEVNVIVDIPQSGPLDLQIVDLNGKTVYQMQNDHVQEGTQWIRLNNLNLSSGVYILRLEAKGLERSEQVVIRK